MQKFVLDPARYTAGWFQSLSSREYTQFRRSLTLAETKTLSEVQLFAWKNYLLKRLSNASTNEDLGVWTQDKDKTELQQGYTDIVLGLLDDYCFVCDRLIDMGIPIQEEG